jgi:CheY-like chemotaxis protein
MELGVPRILLVDDEEDMLPEYQELLEIEGLPAITCSDPALAFDMVIRRPEIALMVTDLRMAPLDGATLIRRLRKALPATRAIRFIILTGDLAEKIDLNVPVMFKPVDTDAFVAAIRDALASAA